MGHDTPDDAEKNINTVGEASPEAQVATLTEAEAGAEDSLQIEIDSMEQMLIDMPDMDAETTAAMQQQIDEMKQELASNQTKNEGEKEQKVEESGDEVLEEEASLVAWIAELQEERMSKTDEFGPHVADRKWIDGQIGMLEEQRAFLKQKKSEPEPEPPSAPELPPVPKMETLPPLPPVPRAERALPPIPKVEVVLPPIPQLPPVPKMETLPPLPPVPPPIPNRYGVPPVPPPVPKMESLPPLPPPPPPPVPEMYRTPPPPPPPMPRMENIPPPPPPPVEKPLPPKESEEDREQRIFDEAKVEAQKKIDAEKYEFASRPMNNEGMENGKVKPVEMKNLKNSDSSYSRKRDFVETPKGVRASRLEMLSADGKRTLEVMERTFDKNGFENGVMDKVDGKIRSRTDIVNNEEGGPVSFAQIDFDENGKVIGEKSLAGNSRGGWTEVSWSTGPDGKVKHIMKSFEANEDLQTGWNGLEASHHEYGKDRIHRYIASNKRAITRSDSGITASFLGER